MRFNIAGKMTYSLKTISDGPALSGQANPISGFYCIQFSWKQQKPGIYQYKRVCHID